MLFQQKFDIALKATYCLENWLLPGISNLVSVSCISLSVDIVAAFNLRLYLETGQLKFILLVESIENSSNEVLKLFLRRFKLRSRLS